jgi:hypothetical protein
MLSTLASIWRSGSSRFDEDARVAGAMGACSVKASLRRGIRPYGIA